MKTEPRAVEVKWVDADTHTYIQANPCCASQNLVGICVAGGCPLCMVLFCVVLCLRSHQKVTEKSSGAHTNSTALISSQLQESDYRQRGRESLEREMESGRENMEEESMDKSWREHGERGRKIMERDGESMEREVERSWREW